MLTLVIVYVYLQPYRVWKLYAWILILMVTVIFYSSHENKFTCICMCLSEVTCINYANKLLSEYRCVELFFFPLKQPTLQRAWIKIDCDWSS